MSGIGRSLFDFERVVCVVRQIRDRIRNLDEVLEDRGLQDGCLKLHNLCPHNFALDTASDGFDNGQGEFCGC